ncbi:MAG TPA: hypothetical protein VFJ65_11175 [Solirubrobacterales bacterium]|nr:hypothetical protein [Solirubrobacterales bacterium]
MAEIDLTDAREKLKRARHHFDVLRAQVEPFEKSDSHRFSFEVDADTGIYTFYIHDLGVPDPDWGLITGDCLHNARTALDYLAVRLYALGTGTDPSDVSGISFPIAESPDRFQSNPSVAGFKNELGLSGYLARIEEMQPFNAGNPSIWGFDEWPINPGLPAALNRLSRLDNIDKHRVIHVVWIGVAPLHGVPMRPPASFKALGGGTRLEPLEDDAEVGTLSFEGPLPGEWNPSQMEMQRHFPLEVAFDEPSPANALLETLWFCLWGVEAALGLFDPVFAAHQPPRPVTDTLG